MTDRKNERYEIKLSRTFKAVTLDDYEDGCYPGWVRYISEDYDRHSPMLYKKGPVETYEIITIIKIPKEDLTKKKDPYDPLPRGHKWVSEKDFLAGNHPGYEGVVDPKCKTTMHYVVRKKQVLVRKIKTKGIS